jgi:hypothetical protein
MLGHRGPDDPRSLFVCIAVDQRAGGVRLPMSLRRKIVYDLCSGKVLDDAGSSGA